MSKNNKNVKNTKRVIRSLNPAELNTVASILKESPTLSDADIAHALRDKDMATDMSMKDLRNKIRYARLKMVDEDGVRVRHRHLEAGSIIESAYETSKPDNPARGFRNDELVKEANLDDSRYYLKAYTESEIERPDGTVLHNTHKKFMCVDPRKFDEESAVERSITNLLDDVCKRNHLSKKELTARLGDDTEVLATLRAGALNGIKVNATPDGMFSIILPETDLHFGEGDAEKLVKSYKATKMNYVLPLLKSRYFSNGQNNVRTIDVVCMGDLIHCDNAGGTTTAGTPLLPKTDAYESFDICVDYLDWWITTLRNTFKMPVRFVYVYGNHDNNMGFGIARMIARIYKYTDGVECIVNENLKKSSWYKEAERNPEYMWMKYGNVGVTYTHGKFMKKNMKEIPEVANPNARKEVEFNVVMYGHLHHISEGSSYANQHNYGLSTPNFVRDHFGKSLGCVTDPEFYIVEINHMVNRASYTPIPSLPYDEQPEV